MVDNHDAMFYHLEGDSSIPGSGVPPRANKRELDQVPVISVVKKARMAPPTPGLSGVHPVSQLLLKYPGAVFTFSGREMSAR